jgi:hypothetical protein
MYKERRNFHPFIWIGQGCQRPRLFPPLPTADRPPSFPCTIPSLVRKATPYPIPFKFFYSEVLATTTLLGLHSYHGGAIHINHAPPRPTMMDGDRGRNSEIWFIYRGAGSSLCVLGKPPFCGSIDLLKP